MRWHPNTGAVGCQFAPEDWKWVHLAVSAQRGGDQNEGSHPKWGAELAVGEGRGRIYIVEPTGAVEERARG
jgi:hypothetical protein